MPDEPSSKPVVEKLGARPGQRWVLLGAGLETQAADLEAIGVRTLTRLPAAADAILFRAEATRDLDRLTRVRAVQWGLPLRAPSRRPTR